jgi:uncharacterized membrane protein
MEPNSWSLSLVYFFHLAATVVWIGGLTSSVLFVLPSARRTLDANAYAVFFDRYRRRLDAAGWLCLLVLLGSGLFQMSAHPQYEGFLAIHNRWAAAIFLKHLAFGGMTAVSALMTWWILPELNRLALRQAQGVSAEGLGKFQQREIWLMRINAILSLIILALTALARVS